jgi:predicted DsbA family dithiol-disulfide isomerase
MEIEIWSDVICPFCGIGNARLERAIEAFEHRDDVTVVHRSFQLDPNAPVGETRPVREMLRAKYGLSSDQLEAQHARMQETAAEEGLVPYLLTDNRVGNTELAHQLAAHAAEHGVADEAWHALYRRYFGEAGDIFTIDGLVEVAVGIGLDADEARAALEERRYTKQIWRDTAEAQRLGATGVPFVVIDRKFGVAGAQPFEVFEDTLQRAWDDGHPVQIASSDADAICGPDGCALPA